MKADTEAGSRRFSNVIALFDALAFEHPSAKSFLYGYSAILVNPVFSAKPNMTLKFCTA